MTNIEEISALMPELMEHVKNAGKEFDERAIEIINEIADCAEKTELYKDVQSEFADSDDYKYCKSLNAEELYKQLLIKIVYAPSRIHMLSVPILLVPMLRAALREEGRIK